MVAIEFAQGQEIRVNIGSGVPGVYLRPGVGAHRLEVAVSVTSVGLPQGLPIQLGGDMYTDLPGAAHRWIGVLHLTQLATREGEQSVQLACSISDSQLRVIEALREGTDLPLILDLKAVLLYPTEGIWPIRQAQEQARVPAETWARTLEGLGAVSVIEILVPLPADGIELRQAVTRIQQAKGDITDGRYEEAVIAARTALDYVRQLTATISPAAKNAQLRTQPERWRALIDALYSLASGAPHDDETTSEFKWNRDDAVMIVGAVAGFLGRLPNA